MERNERIYLPPKRGRLPYKGREHSRGDRWIFLWLMLGVAFWGGGLYWWLS